MSRILEKYYYICDIKNKYMSEEIKQTPIYLPESKKEKVKKAAKSSRLSFTQWVEQAIDFKLKKEVKNG